MRRSRWSESRSGLWDVVDSDRVVRKRKGLELLVDSCQADNHTVELFLARKTVVVWTTTEEMVAWSSRITESGGAREHGISADICEEIKRLARGKAALGKDLAELGNENRIG